MVSRDPAVQAEYNLFKQQYTGTCPFCDAIRRSDDLVIIANYHHFVIMKNQYPYDTWDSISVNRHFMIIPKRHITTLAKLDIDERTEYVRLLAEYEDAGFSIYSRAAKNTSRSFPHQHTHLIDIGA